jgi:hypothetical protein
MHGRLVPKKDEHESRSKGLRPAAMRNSVCPARWWGCVRIATGDEVGLTKIVVPTTKRRIIMRRRTLTCVLFTVAVHGASVLALDQLWALAASHRSHVDRDGVIEPVAFVLDAVAPPVALAAAARVQLPFRFQLGD